MSEIIEMSIKSDYVDWGISEGIRELFQNAIDADVKGYKMSVDFSDSECKLTIANGNILLPKRSLLLGYTTKRGDIDQIGSFGEGYKLGCLALVKSGCTVDILNGDEIWSPKIINSEKFEQEVLAFEIKKSDQRYESLTFVVSGISQDLWNEAKKQFLIFEDLKKLRTIETPFGVILESPELFGSFYINGILVEKVSDEQFAYGYNFKTGQVSVDRDRKMINRHQTKDITGKMWVHAANQNDTGFSDFENLLKRNAPDIQNLRWSWNVTAALKKKLAESFIKSYGERAVPVMSQSEVELVNHMGRMGLVYGDAYVHLVQEHMGDLDKLKKEFSEIIKEEFDTVDLTPEESANLFQAWNLLSTVRGVKTLPSVNVVDFADETQLGVHASGPDGDIVYVARKVLSDLGQTLRVIIHEAGHRKGAHESKEFQDFVEESWKDICMLLLKRQYKAWDKTKNFTEATI